ncbi:MAG: hypothetical protein ACE37I_06315 [Rubinisphaera brasiliensis]|uniref:hypothetical protein n=1 Tax=Rubinisphaera brasiliensis TaxID=119 RepID=UPI003919CDB1
MPGDSRDTRASHFAENNLCRFAYNRKGLPKLRQTLGIQIEIVRKIARGFEVLPKRWIVERTLRG